MAQEKTTSSKSLLLFFIIWAYSTDVFINLFSCFYRLNAPRKISKCLLLPLLLCLYLQITNKEARSKFVIYGIIAGYIGDILLINDNKICLILGIFSFLLCQISYIIDITSRIEMKIWKEKIWTAFGLLIIFGCFCSYVYKYYLAEGCIRDNLQLPGIVYLTSSGLFNMISLFYLINKKTFNGLMIFVGSSFFFISDYTLSIQTLYVNTFFGSYSLFVIMLTYIIAQTLVCVGLSNEEKKHNIIRKCK